LVSDSDDNLLHLSARLVECEPLRFTPAGVAVCQGLLEHESSQMDAGHERQVRLRIAARFAGDMAERITREPLGQLLRVTGFLAAKRMFRDGSSSSALMLHVATYQQQISDSGSAPCHVGAVRSDDN
jgi:primosomal replication protein N